MTIIPGHLLDLARIADHRCDGAFTQRVAAAILQCLPRDHRHDTWGRQAELVAELDGRRRASRQRSEPP